MLTIILPTLLKKHLFFVYRQIIDNCFKYINSLCHFKANHIANILKICPVIILNIQSAMENQEELF